MVVELGSRARVLTERFEGTVKPIPQCHIAVFLCGEKERSTKKVKVWIVFVSDLRTYHRWNPVRGIQCGCLYHIHAAGFARRVGGACAGSL